MGGGIAASIILGLVEAGTALFSGYQQREIMKESQDEARELNERQIEENRETRESQERIQKRSLALQRKQLRENTRLREEELGMLQEQNARKSFRDQVTRLTSILEGNEGLKSLYINRLKGLRN